jgi:hypothetical protein
MKIHSLEHIVARCEAIQLILEAHYDNDQGNILNDRITLINALMAESGKLVGDSNFHYKTKLKSDIMETLKSFIPDYTSASVQNNLVKSLCATEESIFINAQRINASCTHQLDAMRSQLSYLKSLPNH